MNVIIPLWEAMFAASLDIVPARTEVWEKPSANATFFFLLDSLVLSPPCLPGGGKLTQGAFCQQMV